MRLYDKLTREELFNSKIDIERSFVNDDNKEEFWKIYSLYNNRRHKENYNRQSFENLIKENRFNYGIVTVRRNDEIIAYTGLCDFHNWIIFTRMAYLKYAVYPFLSGYLVPYVIEIAKKDNKNGIAITFNKDTHYFVDVLRNNFAHHYSDDRHMHLTDHEIYINTQKNRWTVLDYTVKYRNTEQFVAYIPFNTSLELPFEKWQ